MNKELEKESLGTNTLKPPKNKATESAATQEVSNNSNSSSKEDTIVLPPLPSLEPKPDFNAVYDILHGKFPEIININKPVLLAVGIRKEMSKETGVSSVVLKRWIACILILSLVNNYNGSSGRTSICVVLVCLLLYHKG